MLLLYPLFLISDHIPFFLVSSSEQVGRLPLHEAAMNGRVEVVRFLLEFNPDIYSDRVYEVSW